MWTKYYDGDHINDVFNYKFSYDDIINPTNKITKCLDDVWKYATTLKWADPPGDLRYPSDSMPSITASNITAYSNTSGETDDSLLIYITLTPNEREYRVDTKILMDPEEFQYLIHELAIDLLTHGICAYDETRKDLKSMVIIKHFLDQLALHLKHKFGMWNTSRVLRRYSWLSRDQKISLMSNNKEEKI